MSYLADINDEALIVLAQNSALHKLECRGCPSLKGDGFLRFVKNFVFFTLPNFYFVFSLNVPNFVPFFLE